MSCLLISRNFSFFPRIIHQFNDTLERRIIINRQFSPRTLKIFFLFITSLVSGGHCVSNICKLITCEYGVSSYTRSVFTTSAIKTWRAALYKLKNVFVSLLLW